MRIQVRNDAVVIDGYVNVVERDSVKMQTRTGKMIEKIKQGAFGRSLKRRTDVKVLLNHDPGRVLASTGTGTAVLREDPVGLYCRATVSDAEVIEKAKTGRLSGWSFGFMSLSDGSVQDKEGVEHRDVYDLDLREVSILDDQKTPAYPANCINTRDDEGDTIEIRTTDDPVEVNDTDANTGDGVADTSDASDDAPETGDPVNRNYSYRNALKRAEIR